MSIFTCWNNKQTNKKAEVWPNLKACWSFCFELKVLSESKYLMPWVRCAFGNVFKSKLDRFESLWTHFSRVTFSYVVKLYCHNNITLLLRYTLQLKEESIYRSCTADQFCKSNDWHDWQDWLLLNSIWLLSPVKTKYTKTCNLDSII